jgi:hypothetical protein
LTTTVIELSDVVDALTGVLPEISARTEEFEQDRMLPADLVARLSASRAFRMRAEPVWPGTAPARPVSCSALSRVDPDSGVGNIHPKENS